MCVISGVPPSAGNRREDNGSPDLQVRDVGGHSQVVCPGARGSGAPRPRTNPWLIHRGQASVNCTPVLRVPPGGPPDPTKKAGLLEPRERGFGAEEEL